MVFRGEKKNIYWREIISENKQVVLDSLKTLDAICIKGYLSFTIDGKPGIRHLLEQEYLNIPIQYCLFHQKATIRRYNTLRPKTECGKAMNNLIKRLSSCFEIEFTTVFKVLKIIFHNFLKERNEKNEFKHKRIRSAFNSLNRNIPWLFTYQNYPHLKIPHTTNSCDGSFAHWKEKVGLHHGLRKDRRYKMIASFLSENSNSIS